MPRPRSSALGLLALLLGCGTKYTPPDLDGDGLTAVDGDCWDAPEGPVAGGPGGADIHPGADEAWYDGVDQDCAGDDDYDQDGDGEPIAEGGGADCDDLEASVHPGADEVPYDGVDQDCDEADLVDQDGDGYDAADAGGVDCDDLDPEVFPGAAETWYDGVDQDCGEDDDFDQDGDGSRVDEDCDDLDASRYPGVDVNEVWYNGFDEDCDGNDGDKDGDGYVPDGYAALYDWTAFPEHVGAGDCWDDPEDRPSGLDPLNGFPELDAPDLSPAATETWYDGIDQNCSGDDDFDQDGDGYQSAGYENSLGDRGDDCIDGSDRDEPNPAGLPEADAHPGAAETWYDGTDADCDGAEDYDQDGDGFTSSAYGVGSADDCDDLDEAVNPDEIEDCDTALTDDDCDGSTNDPGALGCTDLLRDMDGDGYGADLFLCLCEPAGDYSATVGDDCDDTSASASPAGSEVCDDADADEDCDGVSEDADPSATGATTGWLDGDGDGYGDPSDAVTACDLPPAAVLNDDDCDDGDETINPAAAETCDPSHTDEDCDGLADDDDSGPTGTSEWHRDGDGDGYGDPADTTDACDRPSGALSDGTDCDDGRADIHPGATEVCDGADLDEDCDGLADDDDSSASGKGTVYVDADDDGYGDPGRSSAACDLSAGFAANPADCDDGDAAINPAASERCDASNTDEDCDGLADDDDPSASGETVWYRDGDGDGYGSALSTLGACELPAGYSTSSSDCDDGGSARYPGAPEVCGDGVVNDCSSTDEAALDACRLAGDLGESDALAIRTGADRRDLLGQTMGWAGDVDGDGVGDLLLGAPSASTGSEVGQIYLMSGLWADGEARASSDYTAAFLGGTVGDRAGAGLAGGDGDLDGYSDLLIGAPGEDATITDAGSVIAFDGPIEGSFVLDASPGAISAQLYGDGASDGLGAALAQVGDSSGDGVPELALGATGADLGADGGGAVYFMHGPPDLYSDVSSADARIYGETSGDGAGAAIAAAGDLDGDGLEDLVAGASGADAGGLSDSGLVGIFLSPLAGDLGLSAGDGSVRGANPGDLLGASVAGGLDTDGDGYGDLLLGAPGYAGSGVAALLLGAATAPGSLSVDGADGALKGVNPGDEAGEAVASAGDIDGDGLDDLLVGAPGLSTSLRSNVGSAFLVYGAFTGTLDLSASDLRLQGDAGGEAMGQALLGAGDLDGDGNGELLIGAPGRDSGDGNRTGAALLILGSGF